MQTLPDIIQNILFVGCGSFLGGVARYIISVVMKGASKGFPWGTLLVNLAGCLFIGLLWGHFGKNCNECSSWYLFLTVGLCGGFTTFSTFSKEALTMLQAGQICGFATYVVVSVFAGIALAALGYYVAR